MNFVTPPKRAKKAVPLPSSPPPSTRAPGGWDSQEEDQAAFVSDMLFNSEDLMRLSQRLVDEVENRTTETIRSGRFSLNRL